jgi:alanyl-tRNA synthetase
MLNSYDIREKYLNFFKRKNHSIIKSASLIPENDPSTLFVGSGMQPLLPYLLGEKHPRGKRLVNFQKAFRTDDIEEIGDSKHTTFFEMLGNWSLGDYFKEEQLNWIYQFLIEELKIEPKRLYATVYEGNQEIGINKDLESIEILKKIFQKYNINVLNEERIFSYGNTKNWWSRTGPPANMSIGEPGGPDSEIFYDLGLELKKHEKSEFKDQKCHLNCDCGRFIEIGNSVFMEYIKNKNGFEKLSQKNVDFGGGLERITMVLQNKDNIFETDLFNFLIQALEEKSKKKYRDHKKSFEIISDHLRAITFLITDGVLPSNKDQGYFVRRLIRRSVIHLKKIKINPFEISHFVSLIIKKMSPVYNSLSLEEKTIQKNIKQEIEKFSLTVDRGLKLFRQINLSNKKISGEDVFILFTTYGFPIELIQELAAEQGYSVDLEEFRNKMKEHQTISKKGIVQKFKGGLADESEKTTKLHTATHLLLQALRMILGNHIIQRGSNITAERLRFDFSHSEKISDENIKKIEEIVNNIIKQELPVSFREISLLEAEKMRAIGVFQTKYNKDMVKVYQIGEDENIFSLEICGGPHVGNTKELGVFKIIKQESISAGIKRIKAILI